MSSAYSDPDRIHRLNDIEIDRAEVLAHRALRDIETEAGNPIAAGICLLCHRLIRVLLDCTSLLNFSTIHRAVALGPQTLRDTMMGPRLLLDGTTRMAPWPKNVR
jgi:hypothetical protein